MTSRLLESHTRSLIHVIEFLPQIPVAMAMSHWERAKCLMSMTDGILGRLFPRRYHDFISIYWGVPTSLRLERLPPAISHRRLLRYVVVHLSKSRFSDLAMNPTSRQGRGAAGQNSRGRNRWGGVFVTFWLL